MTDEPKTNEELYAVFTNEHPVEEGDLVKIQKLGARIPISAEGLETWKLYFDPFRKRKVKGETWVVPDPEVVAAFKEWEARYDAIRREGFDKDFLQTGYDGDWTEEPEAHWEYEYEYEYEEEK